MEEEQKVEVPSSTDVKMADTQQRPNQVEEETKGSPQPEPPKTQSNILKSSSLPQDEELRRYLTQLLTGDSFNKFCVDCMHKQSTHALLAYGTFVCTDCAKQHIAVFKGRSYSIVKDIYNEQWDDYQLEAIAPGVGGNKAFFTYMQNYEGLAQLPIEKKYASLQIDWYVKKLTAHLDQKPFTEIPPAKDWNESFARAKKSVKSLIKRGDKPAKNNLQDITKSQDPQQDSSHIQPQSVPAQPEPQVDQQIGAKQPGKWKSKITTFFKGKFSKGSETQNKQQPQLENAQQQQPSQPDEVGENEQEQ